LEALAAEPAGVLRSGGLGVRELRRLSRAVGLDEPTAALLLEVGYAAGLLGESGDSEMVFVPAAGYDSWRAGSLARRWHRLANAWLLMTRAPALVGQRDDRDRPISALSPEVERMGAPAQRRSALSVLAEAPSGYAPTVDQVREILTWRSPRRAGRSAAATVGYEAVLAEAAALGLTGLGALSGYGRLLLSEVDSQADADEDPLGVRASPAGAPSTVETLDALLPRPVDHVLVQADLTIVVPGPAEPGLAAELSAVADPESPSVYRVTTESVRRALDSGYSAADVHGVFSRRSRTPVPQAMTYLVDDVARRHGGLRAGTAGAYLRSDDEALIAEVLADRRLS